MLGGEDSTPHRYRLVSEGRPPRELRTKETGIEIRPGDCLVAHSAGGGGFGPASKRSPASRERDRLQGLVTSVKAK
jgi:N-methylhydantoinase B